MPTVFAASTMSVPAGTEILCPSMVRLMSGICRNGPHVAFVPQSVVLVLLAEVAKRRVDHPTGGVPQAAEAPAVLQAIGDALQRVELDLRPLVGQDALVRAHRPVAADSTRRALAARLIGIELEQAVSRPNDAVCVVHHDDAAR